MKCSACEATMRLRSTHSPMKNQVVRTYYCRRCGTSTRTEENVVAVKLPKSVPPPVRRRRSDHNVVYLEPMDDRYQQPADLPPPVYKRT